MKVSILVPLRPERGAVGKTRSRNWKWINQRWATHFPEAEVVVGTDDGDTPFSKTQAVNDAYARATGDVFVIADADSWVDMPQLVKGLHYAEKLGVLVVPWLSAYRLSEADSKRILALDPGTPSPVTADVRKRADSYRPAPATAAMVVIIRREDFERVGGMDPRFRGWGQEDVCFSLACGTLLGRPHIMPGDAYALWHDRPRVNGIRVWEDDPGYFNSKLGDRYWSAKGKQGEMLSLCVEHPLVGAQTAVGLGPSANTRPVPEYVPELVPDDHVTPNSFVREFIVGPVQDGDRIAL